MRHNALIVLTAVLTLTGCLNKYTLISETPKNVFVAESGCFEDTRTSLDAGNRIIWSADDEIMIFQGNESGNVYRLSEKAAGSCTGAFEAVGEILTGEQFDSNIAVYPAGAVTGFSASDEQYEIGITIPEVQTYKKGSFAEESFIMTATTSSLNDKRLKFKNLSGALKFSFKGTEIISCLKLRGNADEVLAGDAEVIVNKDGSIPEAILDKEGAKEVILDCGENGVELSEWYATDFIFSLCPTPFDQGFTLTIVLNDGSEFTLSTDNANSVRRSAILNMPLCLVNGMVLSGNQNGNIKISSLNAVSTQIEVEAGAAQYFYGGIEMKDFTDIQGALQQMNEIVKYQEPTQYLQTNRYPYGFTGNPYMFYYDYEQQMVPGYVYLLYHIPYYEGKEYYTQDDVIVLEFEVPYPEKGGSDEILLEDPVIYPLEVRLQVKDGNHYGYCYVWMSEEEYLASSSILEDILSHQYIERYSYWQSYSTSLAEGESIYFIATAIDHNGKYGNILTEKITLAGYQPGGECSITEISSETTSSDVSVTLSSEDAAFIYYKWTDEAETEGLDNEQLSRFIMSNCPQSAIGQYHTLSWGTSFPGESVSLAALPIDADGKAGTPFRKTYSSEEYRFNDIQVTSVSSSGYIYCDGGGTFCFSFDSQAYGYFCAVVAASDYRFHNDLSIDEQYLIANSHIGSKMMYDTASDTFTYNYQDYMAIGEEYRCIVMAVDASGVMSHAAEYRFLPSPSDSDLTGWGITGYFNEWNADLPMVLSGDYLVYEGFTINEDYTEDDTDPLEFKFRKDASWNWNYGATFKGHHIVGEEYRTMQGGPNIVLPDKGTYDIYLSRFLDRYYIMNAGEKPSDIE